MTNFDLPNNVSSMKYALKWGPGLADVGVPHGIRDGPRSPPRSTEGVWIKFQMTYFDMPNNVSSMKYTLRSVPGLKWLRYHQWPMQPLFGLWFWRPWSKTSLPFSLFSPYSIPTVCKNGQDCAEHFYMIAQHSTQPRPIWKKVFRGWRPLKAEIQKRKHTTLISVKNWRVYIGQWPPKGWIGREVRWH